MKFETFERIAKDAIESSNRSIAVPVYRHVGADLITPVSAFLKLAHGKPYSFLFESVEGGEKLGRYSFIGADPYKVIRSFGPHVFVEQPNTVLPTVAQEGNILDVLKRELDEYDEVKLPGLPRLTCGAVGFMGYDTIRVIEHLPAVPQDELETPDAMWCFYKSIVAFDHVQHRVVLQSVAFVNRESNLRDAYDECVTEIDKLAAQLASATMTIPEPIQVDSKGLSSNMSRQTFEDGVRRGKELIVEGDIFQVVLSQRFSIPITGDAINLYRALRQVSPAPYLFFLSMGNFVVAGSSPEMLVRVEDGRAETMPIAGTRPRGATPDEDLRLADELLADKKERAEHLMLVDLGRNDLGRVCEYGTVEVDRMAYIERFSHVMHIVSNVSGSLRQDRRALDALMACFPAGTVSGAPKVRAMEIIDETEPTKRGLYAGAIGYLDFSGNLDTCIAIRTMVVKDGVAHVQAGAGIVADSVPATEFEETRNKAKALIEAIHSSAEGLL